MLSLAKNNHEAKDLSLYGQYLAEITNDLIIEDEFGFATYRYLSETQVYIIDIYVRPEFRNKNMASKYADKVVAIAKAKYPSMVSLIGTVNLSANKNPTSSIKALLGYGMTLDSAANNAIFLRKEI